MVSSCLSKHTPHYLNRLFNSFVLDAYGERSDDDKSVIVNIVPVSNTFDSVPDSCPRKLVSASDDAIAILAENCGGHAVLSSFCVI